MSTEENGRRDQGRFEGEVIAKLESAAVEASALWKRIADDRDELRREITDLRISIQKLSNTIAFGKGFVASVATFASILASVVTTIITRWLRGEK